MLKSFYPQGRAEHLALKIYNQQTIIRNYHLNGCRDLRQITWAKAHLKTLEREFDQCEQFQRVG